MLMDSDIKKDNPQVTPEDVKGVLEYTPSKMVKPDVVDERTGSYIESITEERIKKIRTESDKFRGKYPWEEPERELQYVKKEEQKEPYTKKVYNLPPSSFYSSGVGKIKINSSYVITNQDATTVQQEAQKDNSTMGKPGEFIQKTGSGIVTNQGHLYGWNYKVLPGTENIKNIEIRLSKIQSKNKEGSTNGKLPNRLLATIDGVNLSGGKNSLHYEAAGAYNKMYAAAKAEGITIKLSGTISAYRTYNEQVGCWERNGHNKKLAAVPGTSNHGLGRAIDVAGKIDNHKAQKWINLNGDRFGWYWGDARSEEWHFVYVW
jgi:LAS superfamily LD-carboxypeptidase LdcB